MSAHKTSDIGLFVGYEQKKPYYRLVDGEGNVLDMTDDERAAYFAAHPVYSAIQPVTVDGQEMIRIPAFFIKTFDHNFTVDLFFRCQRINCQ